MEEHIINKVRSGLASRNEVIKMLYKDDKIRKAVIGTLIKLGADEKSAKDHFTDAIVGFIKSCYKPDFVISSSLTNYLIGTAKNIWLKEVTKSHRHRTTLDYDTTGLEPPIEDTLIKKERKTLLQQILNQLDDTCKKVLTLWSLNKKMREIAEKLEYKSEGMARKKKHQCLQRLYAIIDAHPNIKKELSQLL